jgi:hypothetical protein
MCVSIHDKQNAKMVIFPVASESNGHKGDTSDDSRDSKAPLEASH